MGLENILKFTITKKIGNQEIMVDLINVLNTNNQILILIEEIITFYNNLSPQGKRVFMLGHNNIDYSKLLVKYFLKELGELFPGKIFLIKDGMTYEQTLNELIINFHNELNSREEIDMVNVDGGYFDLFIGLIGIACGLFEELISIDKINNSTKSSVINILNKLNRKSLIEFLKSLKPHELIDICMSFGDDHINILLSQNNNLSQDQFSKLWGLDNPKIKLQLLKNPCLPKEFVISGINDADKKVAKLSNKIFQQKYCN